MREHVGFEGIVPLLNDARRFLQLNFGLIKQHPLQVYDLAHVWIPEKSLMRERYATVHTPRVLFGLPQSWEPVLHVMQHRSEVNSVAFSPDGGRLVSGSDEIVRIWNTVTGELEDELEGHTCRVWSVAFSHDGCFIVSGSRDKTVRIWNVATCKTTYTLTGHTSWVTSVAISGDDEFVVSGSDDRTVRIWDTATGRLFHVLKGHAHEVNSVAVSPDCQHIASGAYYGEVWIWTKDGIIEHKLEFPSIEIDYVSDLAFSHDGCRLLCNVKGTEWTITGHRLSPPATDDDPSLKNILSVAYSPNDHEIVYGMELGEIMIWNTETKKRRKLGTLSHGITSISFSLDGSRIASGSNDKTVRIWDLRAFVEEMDLGWLNHVALSHDGQWIVTASHNHIQVWRVMETMTKANTLSIKTSVGSVALSRDGTRVVIGCGDGSILTWNHLTNTIQRQKSGRSNHVWSVIWNHLTKRQIHDYSNWVTCAFSYDGSHVVSGLDDNTVQIWNWHTRKEVGLYQHSHQVVCVAFSRDGGRVAFGSYDGTWIWNLSTGQIHSEPDNNSVRQGWVRSVAFSHNGNHVISGWRYHRVWIWDVTTDESTMLSEQIKLPDGTRVHSLSEGDFHIYDPVDQEMTNGIPPHLFSISPGHDWITGEQGEHICWIHPQYRDFFKVHIARSIVCLHTRWHGMIVLDLKRTPHAECITPGVRVSPG